MKKVIRNALALSAIGTAVLLGGCATSSPPPPPPPPQAMDQTTTTTSQEAYTQAPAAEQTHRGPRG